MAYTITAPRNSFVKFEETTGLSTCYNQTHGCLPVYAPEDWAFQFYIQADTDEEADALCEIGSSGFTIGLVRDCDQAFFDLELTESPERYKIDGTTILVNWSHGFPDFFTEFDEGECFVVKIVVGDQHFCSNCFTRITAAEACDTSVVDYGNNDNAFGFAYCTGGEGVIDPGTGSCEPTVISFTEESELTIPYTTMLQNQYGPVPAVQVWVFNDAGELQNMGIEVRMDDVPATQIMINLGGPASGRVIIR